jgi:integrase
MCKLLHCQGHPRHKNDVKLDPRIIPVYTFMRETSCRRGEAITLKLSQIDFARLTVTFHTNTKNGKSQQVPLTDEAIWAVQALPKNGSTIFYNPATLKPWTGEMIAIVGKKPGRLSDRDLESMTFGMPTELNLRKMERRCTSYLKSWGITPWILLERIMLSFHPNLPQERFFEFFKEKRIRRVL